MTQTPAIHIPTRDELEDKLSIGNSSIDERIAYVRHLLIAAEQAARGLENMQKEIDRLTATNDGMKVELRGLRQKLGDLDGGSRTALDQRYDMLGKMTRARNEVDQLESAMKDAIIRMRDALKK